MRGNLCKVLGIKPRRHVEDVPRWWHFAGADFTSPLANRIDRATYFEHCWPNSERISGFDLIRLVSDGEEVFVTYEATTRDDHRFRNTEILTIRHAQIVNVEVYFGWSLPRRLYQRDQKLKIRSRTGSDFTGRTLEESGALQAKVGAQSPCCRHLNWPFSNTRSALAELSLTSSNASEPRRYWVPSFHAATNLWPGRSRRRPNQDCRRRFRGACPQRGCLARRSPA